MCDASGKGELEVLQMAISGSSDSRQSGYRSFFLQNGAFICEMSEEAQRRMRLKRKRLEVAVRAHELMQRVQHPPSFTRIISEVRRAGRIH